MAESEARRAKTAEDLKIRTKKFAIAILDFVDTLPRTPSGDAVARQLARSGLGTAGNYRGACRARSHTEFTARLGVVLEEADESELWLDVSDARRMGDVKLREPLLTESGELRAIFSKACTTARIREHRQKHP
jgi:four helix bundle protein